MKDDNNTAEQAPLQVLAGTLILEQFEKGASLEVTIEQATKALIEGAAERDMEMTVKDARHLIGKAATQQSYIHRIKAADNLQLAEIYAAAERLIDTTEGAQTLDDVADIVGRSWFELLAKESGMAVGTVESLLRRG